LVLGFGFVVFFHELGHFLAVTWVGVKVEQFAVGFGQAVVAGRKGLGFRFGTTQQEYERRIIENFETQQRAKFELTDRKKIEEGDEVAARESTLDAIRPPTTEQMEKMADELGLGETEYRINWIPL